MTQTLRMRKGLASRKRVRTPPLFPIDPPAKKPAPAFQPHANWFKRLDAWFAGCVRSFGARCMNYGR